MARQGQATLLEELSRRGPHEVCAATWRWSGYQEWCSRHGPVSACPPWLSATAGCSPRARYRDLLRHLASWGIVAAAPATQRGPLASHRLLASDLRTTLDVCTGVRLGDGEISVDPERLGLAGHSIGGGCAVLAAAEDKRVRAVATLARSRDPPASLCRRAQCTMPALHIAAGKDDRARRWRTRS